MNDTTKIMQGFYVTNLVGKPVSVQIETVQGHAKILSIPATWIPINLAIQAKIANIVDSPDFFRAIDLNLIKIIEEEDALQILKTGDAKKEQNRLRDGSIFQPVHTKSNKTEDNTSATDETNHNLVRSAIDENSAINQFMMIIHRGQLTAKLSNLLLDVSKENNWEELYEKIGQHN